MEKVILAFRKIVCMMAGFNVTKSFEERVTEFSEGNA
jgi:hypothetical protein